MPLFGQGPREMFSLATGFFYGSSVQSNTPTAPATPGWDDSNGRAHSESAGLTWSPYLLLFDPIKPGTVQNVSIRLHIALSGSFPHPASGTVIVTGMTTPATWDAQNFTYNTKPAISAADPNITQHFESTGVASTFTAGGYNFYKTFTFDFSKITQTVVGFAIQAIIDPGLTSAVIDAGVPDATIHIFTAPRSPRQFSVIARQSLIVDGQSIRRLYLAAGSIKSFFTWPYLAAAGSNLPASYAVWVQGVGVTGAIKTSAHAGVDYYDSDLALSVGSNTPQTTTYFTTAAWNAANDTLDLVRDDGMTAYTEPKTPCGGTIYYNL